MFLLEKLVISRRKRKKSRHERQTERERLFLDNGSKVLEELVATCNGKHTPIRSFSHEELRLATDNFDGRRVLHDHRIHPIWYKGSLDDRTISIKYEKNRTGHAFFTDIAISAKVSAHKNVLKLVGCCLETQSPTLVYESADGILADRIYVIKDDGTRKECQPIAWQSRLKIAREIAHAVAYLHNAFSRPIIHRDIKLENILLNQHDVPKLTEFSLSISIPEGKTFVDQDRLCGTIGYICPSYWATGRVTEKTDVYSFGMVLLEILTSRRQPHVWEKSTASVTSSDDEGDASPVSRLVNYVINPAISELVDPALRVDGSESGVIGMEEQLQSEKSTGSVKSSDDEGDARPVSRLVNYVRNHALSELVDPALRVDGSESGVIGTEEQLQSVLQLVLKCLAMDPEIRPTMIDVTEELRRIERFVS